MIFMIDHLFHPAAQTSITFSLSHCQFVSLCHINMYINPHQTHWCSNVKSFASLNYPIGISQHAILAAEPFHAFPVDMSKTSFTCHVRLVMQLCMTMGYCPQNIYWDVCNKKYLTKEKWYNQQTMSILVDCFSWCECNFGKVGRTRHKQCIHAALLK